MTSPRIRRATLTDLPALLELECSCFPPARQSTEASLKNSIRSDSQFVLVLEDDESSEGALLGSAILIGYKQSLRIYSIAVQASARGRGHGERLMQQCFETARNSGFEKLTLEADKQNAVLIAWYGRFGFSVREELPDYYGPGESAVRMTCPLKDKHAHSAGNIVVVDSAKKWNFQSNDDIEIVSARRYLSEERFRNSDRFNVLNLCSAYKTLTLGYYVSLLAAARNHRVVPTVMTIKDMGNIPIAQSVVDECREFIERKLKGIEAASFEITVILGRAADPEQAELAKRLYALFEIPCFTIGFTRKEHQWKVRKLVQINPLSIAQSHPELLEEAIHGYFSKKRYRRTRLKHYKYDLAILVNPDEKTPPSCPEALEKFRHAAETTGFFVEFITKLDYRRLCEFDALFIRETTGIENHTYKFARHAHTEGLVVIDDPWSILRCSNKIYLHERLARARIKQPRSWLLTKHAVTPELLSSLAYPLVLKLPESSFSLGVYRVANRDELEAKLKLMFEEGDLVIAQEFLQSSFDWRIGVMDRTPLYACKYYMANDHWQIYNWSQDAEQDEDFSGASESIPINQVPKNILNAAVKASSLIGDSLYGVDLKEIDGQPRIIEINDNPNIDAGVEDELLGDELYLRIMRSFYNRIERERFQPRYLQ
ncbi:GNAT family N-acetyltransferase [Coraliomargarita parva]|uniref:GNAT family N-acetyltransferase n=1 Tax=Coraliomargarita parva TaxID=3014050 RepID=UPI0022B516CA|nr:GNAT family N-acetyltransferase [Coraliomargarita parva]